MFWQKKSVQFFIAISGAVMSFGCLAGGSWPGGLDQLVTLESGPSQPQSVHRSPWDRPDAVQSLSHPSLRATVSPTPTDPPALLQVTHSNYHSIPQSTLLLRIISANKFHPRFLPGDKLYRAWEILGLANYNAGGPGRLIWGSYSTLFTQKD